VASIERFKVSRLKESSSSQDISLPAADSQPPIFARSFPSSVSRLPFFSLFFFSLRSAHERGILGRKRLRLAPAIHHDVMRFAFRQ
jgi:hypothetical protein